MWKGKNVQNYHCRMSRVLFVLCAAYKYLRIYTNLKIKKTRKKVKKKIMMKRRILCMGLTYSITSLFINTSGDYITWVAIICGFTKDYVFQPLLFHVSETRKHWINNLHAIDKRKYLQSKCVIQFFPLKAFPPVFLCGLFGNKSPNKKVINYLFCF